MPIVKDEDTCRMQRTQLLGLLDLSVPSSERATVRMPAIERAIDHVAVDTLDFEVDAAIEREIELGLVDIEIDAAFDEVFTAPAHRRARRTRRRVTRSQQPLRPGRLLLTLVICFLAGLTIMALLS